MSGPAAPVGRDGDGEDRGLPARPNVSLPEINRAPVADRSNAAYAASTPGVVPADSAEAPAHPVSSPDAPDARESVAEAELAPSTEATPVDVVAEPASERVGRGAAITAGIAIALGAVAVVVSALIAAGAIGTAGALPETDFVRWLPLVGAILGVAAIILAPGKGRTRGRGILLGLGAAVALAGVAVFILRSSGIL